MAEGFALGIAQKGLEQLSSLAFREIVLALRAESELQELRLTITTIRTMLLDAERRQEKSAEEMVWLERFKSVCYAADDIVDEFEIIALKWQQQQQQVVVSSSSSSSLMQRRMRMRMRCRLIKSKVHHFFSSSNPLIFHFKIGHHIKNVQQRVARIANEKALFGRQRESIHSLILSHPPVSDICMIFEDSIMMNFSEDYCGEDRENIMLNFLMDSRGPECFSAISIVGIAGIGKTTLAKMVYDDTRVSHYFGLRIWAYVGEDYNLKTLLIRILELVTHQSCAHFHTEQLHNSIKENFKDKRFLLILDNLNNDDRGKWVELCNLFKGGANGSKIIVTTRNRSVASTISPILSCNLKGLSHESSVSLFESWVFGKQGGNHEEHADLMRIGEEIVKKCEGVPLAIKRLAIVLYGIKDKQFWLEVQHDKSWTFNETGFILQPLRESYEQLPSHLKQCFAYCSTFPKDFAVSGIELIYRWIAQGLIQPSNQSIHEMEKIGQEYIRELMSKLFFQDIDGYGYFSTIKMHGLMYELARLVAPTEYSDVDFRRRYIPRTFLHLSFGSSHPFPEEGIPSHLLEFQHVRSLVFQPGADPDRSLVEKCIRRFNRLRMLDLTNSNFETLPSSIADSKHLRYLDLSWNKNIKSLPNSICELQSLQTLGLQGCMRLEKLPKDVAKLISLRCLRLTTRERCLPAKAIGSLKSLRFLLVDECDNLVHLFDGEGIVMQNLLFLVIKNCKNLVSLPQGLSCLTALENLAIVNCEKLDLAEDSGSSSGGGGGCGGGSRGLEGLHYLWIGGLPALVALPRWLLQRATATLNHIRITDCGNFAAFPEELDCLQRLWIERCPRLACLPDEMSCLLKMEEIRISECPQLIKAFWRETGQLWDKVSRVRDIYLDGINVQDPFNILSVCFYFIIIIFVFNIFMKSHPKMTCLQNNLFAR